MIRRGASAEPQPVEAPPTYVRCSVDGCIMHDAVVSKVCKHSFSMKCALDALLKEDACPCCGVAMDCTNLVPDEAARSAVLSLRVHCAAAPRCDWTGTLIDEQRHRHSDECGVPHVRCPFCSKSFERGVVFETHKDECPEQIAICPQCEEDMRHADLAAHVSKCNAKPLYPRKKVEPAAAIVQPEASAKSPQQQQPVLNGAVQSAAKAENATTVDEPKQQQQTMEEGKANGAPQCEVVTETKPAQTPEVKRAVEAWADVSATVLHHPNTTAAPKAQPQSTFAEAATETSTVIAPAPQKSVSADPSLPCPFALLGCDLPQSHTENISSLAVVNHHLLVVCAAFVSMQQRCSTLELEVEMLRRREGGATKRGGAAAAADATPRPVGKDVFTRSSRPAAVNVTPVSQKANHQQSLSSYNTQEKNRATKGGGAALHEIPNSNTPRASAKRAATKPDGHSSIQQGNNDDDDAAMNANIVDLFRCASSPPTHGRRDGSSATKRRPAFAPRVPPGGGSRSLFSDASSHGQKAAALSGRGPRRIQARVSQ